MAGKPYASMRLAFGRALRLAACLAVLPCVNACQAQPAGQLQVGVAAQAMGGVNFTINVPKKSSKQVRRLQATGTESSTLLVNQVDVSLSGPGFFEPLYPPGTEQAKGAISVQSGSISSRIDNVPTGKNRFLKVIAKNGRQKLNQVAGVLDVQPGPYNHVVVGLSTTPTAWVIEKLAIKAPEAARAISAKQLQYFMDTQITKPITDDATRQNTFNGVHPYLVHADGLVDYLIANNQQLPTTFDLTDPAHQAFVLNAGQVRIQLDQPLMAGSRLWLNDPTSDILETTAADAATTEFVIPNVAPNFERTADDATPPAWTLTIMTPDGKLTSLPVAIARKPKSEGALAEVVADLRGSLKAIKRIFLSPTDADWTPATVTINGRKIQQLFVYAVYDEAGGEKVVPLLPSALDWESLDTARLKVGNGASLSPAQLDPALLAADPGLAGTSLEDCGLVYPLAETNATTPKATIKGTMKGNAALSATLDFSVGFLGADTGRVQINVTADGIRIVEGDQTILAQEQPATVTVAEPQAPAGVTYRWVSDHPLISVGAGTGKTCALTALGPLPAGQTATVKVVSSTGRQSTIKVGATFMNGTASGVATAGSITATFSRLPDTNAGNPDVTARAGDPLGGYLNVYLGQGTLQASDPADAAAKFFWFSSDPLTVAVSGTFPSTSATLTARRPGLVTVTAMDLQGRVVTTSIRADFTSTGTATGSLTAPENGISLTGATEASIGTDLKGVFVAKAYAAQERDVASPAFRWISLDPTRLVIEPIAGQSFPHAQATFKSLRPGSVSFQLISAVTGQSRTFTVNPTYVNGTASGTVTAQQLVVKNASGAAVGTYTGKTLGELVDFSATDSTDPGAQFVWTPDNAHLVAVQSQSGDQVRVRVLDYGATAVRVVNTRNGRTAVLNFDIQKTGKGSGDITVTL
jgi:hypothetical protein